MGFHAILDSPLAGLDVLAELLFVGFACDVPLFGAFHLRLAGRGKTILILLETLADRALAGLNVFAELLDVRLAFAFREGGARGLSEAEGEGGQRNKYETFSLHRISFLVNGMDAR